MKIIPAIDLINGQCVRLTQGDYDQKKVYNNNPLEVAKMFEAKGAKYLHVVDLDAAKSGVFSNYDIVKDICEQTSLSVDYGGGIRSNEQIEKALSAGVAQVNIGSLSVKNPKLVQSWIEKYGAEKIILSADVKDRKIAVLGWQEVADIELFDYLEDYLEAGAYSFVCTDISKDGALSGSSIELYNDIIAAFPSIRLIASGGVSSIEEIQQLKENKLYGAIIGKAIYEEKMAVKELFRIK